MSARIRLGVLFGGRSDEHAVSVASARSMMEAVDSAKFDIVPIGITREGRWLLGANPFLLADSQVRDGMAETEAVLADVSSRGLVPAAGRRAATDRLIDVVFPLLHGPFGEDGTVQGVLELAGVPYVGAGVLASAVGMDKGVMKALFEHAGLPVARYVVFTARDFSEDGAGVVKRLRSELGLPLFVKPCRLGSSVGISKARSEDELWGSIAEAFRYDRRVIAEEMIRGREVECGLLGNDRPAVSVFGEIVSTREFYDYEAKYTQGLAELIIPARLTSGQVDSMTDIALRAFRAIDAEGMARVDFFVEEPSGRVIVNEINTIPGFAPTSMFPKLWEASGLPYGLLVERLVELALERHVTNRKDWRP